MDDVTAFVVVILITVGMFIALVQTREQAREFLYVVRWWLNLTELIVFFWSLNRAMGQ